MQEETNQPFDEEKQENTAENVFIESESASPTKPKTTWRLVVLIMLVLAALTSYVLFTQNNSTKKIEILDLKRAQLVSDSLYNELKNTLAIYKQENEELYTQIAQKESVLESQYAKIRRLIAQAKRDKNAQKEIEDKLNNLRTELNNLKAYVDNQTLDLEELKVENRRLKKEKEKLDALYAQELEAKLLLEQQEQQLQEDNALMQKKLNSASVLQVNNIEASILKIKSNGELKNVLLAKNGELMSICFDIVRNEVCEAGVNRFQLRIINPKGAVVFDDNRGSGRLQLYEDAQAINYTVSKIFDYNTNVNKLCMEWYAYPTTYFTAGNYRIELYNKGRLVGNTVFNTK